MANVPNLSPKEGRKRVYVHLHFHRQGACAMELQQNRNVIESAPPFLPSTLPRHTAQGCGIKLTNVVRTTGCCEVLFPADVCGIEHFRPREIENFIARGGIAYSVLGVSIKINRGIHGPLSGSRNSLQFE